MSLSASGLLQAHAGFRRVPQASVPCRARVASSAVMLPIAPTTLSVWADESGHDPLAPVPPLLGKRILITAPRQYAHKLAAKLVAAGARPLWVPGVSITALTPGSPEDLELGTALAALWLPGTSPASVTPSQPSSTLSPSSPPHWLPGHPGPSPGPSPAAGHGQPHSLSETSCAAQHPPAGNRGRGPGPGHSDQQQGLGSGQGLGQCGGTESEALSHGLPAYTHIAFTSKNGIYAVLQHLTRTTGSLEAACEVLRGSGAQLCALGADGQVLLRVGLPLHVSPSEASTQGLVQELVARGEAAGARVLCPVPWVTGGLQEPQVVPRFLAALAAAGATPVRVPAYATSQGCLQQDCTAERQALAAGQVHAIAFTSTAEAQGLVAALGGREVVAQAVAMHQVVLAAHGPYTAQGVGDVLGLPVRCVSSAFHSFDGLVEALAQQLGAA